MINVSKYKNIVLDFDGVILDANKERKQNMKCVLDGNLCLLYTSDAADE